MSEEIKEKIKAYYIANDIDKILNYIATLQQKVEQLEKENKELKQPQVFIDCEDMEERYGRDLYEDYLKEKIEQLESIIKEATEYIKEDMYGEPNELYGLVDGEHLLNILNKGSNIND